MDVNLEYKNKYLKYKQKYLDLKKELSGGVNRLPDSLELTNFMDIAKKTIDQSVRENVFTQDNQIRQTILGDKLNLSFVEVNSLEDFNYELIAEIYPLNQFKKETEIEKLISECNELKLDRSNNFELKKKLRRWC